MSLAGLVLFTCGSAIFRKLAFPLFLLFFMVPIPAIIYNQITFPLQLLASRVAESVLGLIGIPVLREGNILELASPVDEVHILTSLAGFEALLRGKPVTCYGQPFYAGWGLTEDHAPVARRTRRLTLDELVAGALILYPTYVSRTTGRFTTPERALDVLLEWRQHAKEGAPLWRDSLRLALRLGKCFWPRAA